MTRSLPSNPSLEQLKKQAKDLLKAFKAGNTEVCEVLRYHYRFARSSNENILKLVRKVCEDCKEEYEPEAWARESLPHGATHAFFRGKGCDKCHNTGYRGRTAVHEVLEMDDDFRMLVARNADMEELAEAASKSGMVTLRLDGLAKAAQGITTINEVLRVCG